MENKQNNNQQPMVATAHHPFYLVEMTKGMFACWSITTQCCNDATVTILDDTGKVYATYTKAFTQSHDLKILGQGSAIIEGNELRVNVDSSMSAELQASLSTYLISDLNARKVGAVTDICIEDQTDNDFNDVYINVVAWNKKG